jgi:hypothetical protein
MAVASLLTVTFFPDPWRLEQSPVAVNSRLTSAVDPPKNAYIQTNSGRVSFWQACIAVVACFGAQATFFTICGPIFSDLLASHVLLAAGCAMSALMVASCIGAMLARRSRARTAIAFGMAFLAPGVCGFFALAGAVPLWALVPSIAAMGLGHGLGYAGSVRLINETADAAHRAIYTSKFYIAVYIGGGVPVLGRGVLEQLTGQASASAVFSFVIASLAIGVLISLRLTDPARTTVSETG